MQKLAGLFPGVKILHTDVKEPVARPMFKIDILPVACTASCGNSRETAADIDIWYYAADGQHPRDDCEQAAETILNAFYAGFPAGNVWLSPDDDITFTQNPNGVLVCQFGVTWFESPTETGEPMEELRFPRRY